MKKAVCLFVCISSIFIFSACHETKEELKKLEKVKKIPLGYWMLPGIGSVTGRRTDEYISFIKKQDKIFFEFIEVSYKSRMPGDHVTKITEGPYELSYVNNELSFQVRNQTFKYTYREEGTKLVFPAIIKIDDRSWKFMNSLDSCIIHCENNPEVIQQGKASFPSANWEGIKQSYIFTEKNSKRIDFFIHYNDQAKKEYSLIWDDLGKPRIEPNNEHFGIWQKWYTRISEEEFEKIKNIPESETVLFY